MTEIHKPGTGAIFGIVTEEGVAKDDSPVYLYDMRRWDGAGKKKLLSRRFTRQDGGFEFAGLNTDYGDYLVMATDEDGDEPKNALVQDRVNPIPAHAGSGQLSEWYVRAMKDGAQAGFLAWPVYQDGVGGSGEPTLRGLFGRPTLNDTYPVSWPPNPNPPPELPNMASLQFNSLGWGPFSLGRLTYDSTEPEASLELILDIDSIATQSGECIIGGFQSYASTVSGGSVYWSNTHFTRLPTNSSRSQSKLVVGINPDKTLTAYSHNSTTPVNWVSGLAALGTVDLSAYSGMIHIIVTFVPGSAVNFYVNGSLEHTEATAVLGGRTALPFSGGRGWAVFGFAQAFGGSDAIIGLNQHQRDYTFALGVYYNNTLTTQQVQDHYKALYDNDLISPVSGYAREVFIDTPHMYWRMDDFDIEDRLSFASDVNWRDQNTGLGYWSTLLELQGSDLLINPIVQSPIAGRTAVEVVRGNSNFFRGDRAGTLGWLFRDRGSFSCWAKFDLETPAATEFVAELHQRSLSDPYFELARLVNGRLSVRLWEAGALNTYTFTYEPPHDAWQYIAVVVDKTGETDGELRLYVGNESIQPTLQQTLILSTASIYTVEAIREVVAGSSLFRVQAMRELTGSMCELAVFPDILTPERIEAHWNARTVV